jgi:DNA-binding transcriptional regulator YhcF (GntR family)
LIGPRSCKARRKIAYRNLATGATAAPMSAAKTAHKLFALHNALASQTLTRADLYVYAILIEYMDKDDEAWPAAETIATVAGMNARTVQRAFEKLAQSGFIECLMPGGGRTKTNLWHVITPKESPLPKQIEKAKADKAAALLSASTDNQTTASVSQTTASVSKQTRRECHPIPKGYNPKKRKPSAPAAHPMDAVDGKITARIAVIERSWKAGTLFGEDAEDQLHHILVDLDDERQRGHCSRIIDEIVLERYPA